MVVWSNKKAVFDKNCRTPRKLWDSIRFFTAAVARHRTLTIFFLKKSYYHGKSSLNSALKGGKFGSNPFHHPENAIGIFWFRVFLDFQKSEKNGEKRRKPEKILDFSRGIYFDPKTCVKAIKKIFFVFCIKVSNSLIKPQNIINVKCVLSKYMSLGNNSMFKGVQCFGMWFSILD